MMEILVDKSNGKLTVFGASSKPWLIDESLLELIVGRWYFELPGFEIRLEIISKGAAKLRGKFEDEDFLEFSGISEG